jgi:hypothetical protein
MRGLVPGGGGLMGIARDIEKAVRQGVIDGLALRRAKVKMKNDVIDGKRLHPQGLCLRCGGTDPEYECAPDDKYSDKRFPCIDAIAQQVWRHNDNVIARRRVDRWRLAAIAGWTVALGLLVVGWVG